MDASSWRFKSSPGHFFPLGALAQGAPPPLLLIAASPPGVWGLSPPRPPTSLFPLGALAQGLRCFPARRSGPGAPPQLNCPSNPDPVEGAPPSLSRGSRRPLLLIAASPPVFGGLSPPRPPLAVLGWSSPDFADVPAVARAEALAKAEAKAGRPDRAFMEAERNHSRECKPCPAERESRPAHPLHLPALQSSVLQLQQGIDPPPAWMIGPGAERR